VLDQLGVVPRADLYLALIVDNKSKDSARLLMRAAIDDPSISPGQQRDIFDVLVENHGND
jgi:hypothetical protein